MRSKLILKLVALGGMTLALFAVLALASAARPGVVSATANPLPPLVGCPNLDGSTEAAMPPDPTKLGQVKATDMLIVAQHYGLNYGQPGYSSLYDPISPYNSTNPSYPSGTGRIASVDMLYVAQKYAQYCPLVDTQIAEATRALSEPMYSNILCDPNLATPVPCGGDPQFLTENASFLAGKGYYQMSFDVPGQGVHYANMNYWDGVFNPVRPEGLVYKVTGPEDPGAVSSGSCSDGVDNGGDGLTDGADPDCHVSRLVAQLYVVDGAVVGWGTHEATSYPPPTTPHGVDLEGAAGGPHCSPACSWAGAYDGWHMHYYLCTVHIGTSSALAVPAYPFVPSVQTPSGCASYSGGELACTIPITTTPCYRWGQNVGWMGHLWNWLPNANLIPDNGGSNGRFADCYPGNFDNPPPSVPWTAFDCPS